MYLRIVTGLAALLSISAFARPRPVDVPVSAHASGMHAHLVSYQPQTIVPGGPPAELLGAPPTDGGNWSFSDTAAPGFDFAASGDSAGRALDCLTAAIYYEARSEPIDGQRAVAQVVLNRVRNPAFPASVCGVVYQGANRSTGCQFTFTCDGSLLAQRDPQSWARARQVAMQALAGTVYAPVGAATFYHTTAVSPYWAPSLTKVALIGAHIFYRLNDGWANRLDFRQAYSGEEPVGIAAASLASTGGSTQIGDGVDLVSAEGGSIRIHRGASLAPAGVAIHRGGSADTPGDAPAASADDGQVHVHLGTARADDAAPVTASGEQG